MFPFHFQVKLMKIKDHTPYLVLVSFYCLSTILPGKNAGNRTGSGSFLWFVATELEAMSSNWNIESSTWTWEKNFFTVRGQSTGTESGDSTAQWGFEGTRFQTQPFCNSVIKDHSALFLFALTNCYVYSSIYPSIHSI